MWSAPVGLGGKRVRTDIPRNYRDAEPQVKFLTLCGACVV